MPKHFLTLMDYDGRELVELLELAARLKADIATGRPYHCLAGRVLVMIFEKPSLRTRLSFEVAMLQLGGHSIVLEQQHIGIGSREAPADVARVISSCADAIMARTFSHQTLMELARHASVPVINGLSDYSHPCQAMADMLTIQEHFGSLEGRRIAFVGDGNNVARSLAVACAKLGLSFVLACPKGYEFGGAFIDELTRKSPTVGLTMIDDPLQAVQQADVVYTDTWISMGQEAERQQRIRDFAAFQVSNELLNHAPEHAIVLHCLPAYRGFEITEEVLESKRCLAWQQAANRLHFQRALLKALLAPAAGR